MASSTLQPADPSYHDSLSTRSHVRRSSSHRNFASSLSRSGSHVELPRTACPKDGDAFSYNPSHLRSWYLPQELWDRLSAELQSALAAVQHSGAAVLTGFERLDKHTNDVDGVRPEHKLGDDDLFLQLDNLPPPKYRTVSNASSVLQSDMSSASYSESSTSYSGCTSPAISSFSMGHAATPCSPISLASAEETFTDKRVRSREHSFSTPLEAHDAYYATELSHLRTEALPRLRHQARKVDTEWYEAKRIGRVVAEDVEAFENWWADKKSNINSLNEKGKRLATALGLSSTGMGWCAP